MTRLERVRTAAAIPAGVSRAGPHGQVPRSDQAGAWPARWNSSRVWKAAKPQLKIESGGKCAYCESPTDTVAHGDVEHFRPKSVYWWLAYCYDNYVYACQICNQVLQGRCISRSCLDGCVERPGAARTRTPAAIDALAGDSDARRARPYRRPSAGRVSSWRRPRKKPAWSIRTSPTPIRSSSGLRTTR